MNRRTLSACRGAWLACLLLAAFPVDVLRADEMKVDESALGTGVEDRELLGRGESFDEGQKVWFWTRVTGGKPGERIVHVWRREGEIVLSVELEIGGVRWRTWSSKTLHPGSEGRWTVEARNLDGQVLAADEFRCVESPNPDGTE